jgi:hypothetical protein
MVSASAAGSRAGRAFRASASKHASSHSGTPSLAGPGRGLGSRVSARAEALRLGAPPSRTSESTERQDLVLAESLTPPCPPRRDVDRCTRCWGRRVRPSHLVADRVDGPGWCRMAPDRIGM